MRRATTYLTSTADFILSLVTCHWSLCGWLFEADARSEAGFVLDHADDVSAGAHAENNDGKVVVHAQRDRGRIHHPQLLFQNFKISNAIKFGRSRIFDRIG